MKANFALSRSDNKSKRQSCV